MTAQLEVGGKVASNQLSMALRVAAEEVTDFTKSWNGIMELGKQEGFNQQELIEMFKPLVREQLKKQGLEPRQVNQKIYYLVHKDDIIKQQLESRHEKSKILDSEPPVFTDKSALDEIARLHTENTELHEQLDKFSFSDDPNTIVVKRTDDNYFACLKIREIGNILSGVVGSLDKKVNIWFEEVSE